MLNKCYNVKNMKISLWFGRATSEWISLHSDFFISIKNQSYAPSFKKKKKKARSARLFACKRAL